MAAVAAARSVFRSSPLRNVAVKLATEAKAVRPPLRLPKQSPTVPRILRSPVEMSFCVESLLPMHSATASALMTSMLCISRRGYGWLSEDFEDKFKKPKCGDYLMNIFLDQSCGFNSYNLVGVLNIPHAQKGVRVISFIKLPKMTYDEFRGDSSKYLGATFLC